MNKSPRPELNPVRLRAAAEKAASLMPAPPSADAGSDDLKHWHELQVSQIELDLQHEALAELQQERDQAALLHARYAALYDQAPAGYLSLNDSGFITRANAAAGELLVCGHEALLGKRFEQFVAPQAQALLRRFLARLFDSGERAAIEVPLFEPAGDAARGEPRRLRIEANLDTQTRTCRMILTDMGTANMRDAARLRAMQVLSSISEAVLVCDTELRIVSVNHAFTALTGYAVEEALGRNPRFLGRAGAHPPGYHAAAMAQVLRDGRWQGDVFNRRRDGTPYVAAMSITVIRDGEGAITHFIGVFSDVTAQRESDAAQLRWSQELDALVAARTAELTASREELHKLAHHLATVKEEERKRIAHDIHDELGQNLLALRIDLSMLSARTGERHARLHQRVSAALENVDATIRSVRGIMNELRPAVLDLGLLAALEWQAGEFRKRSGLGCRLTLPGEAELAALAALSPEMEIVLFRSLQEALSNVRRHAHARQVDIILAVRDGRLALSVADDGVGMPAAQHGEPEAFGLIGMAQRVAGVGGRLDICNQPAGGCRLTLSFDL
ncbi:PAS domain-containing protein [Pseudoduganella sp. FT25W]|uniref:histidine kinase n=1 Tax=Duganella alba TaxID=2666081 RepID=A0A6L5QEH7_9BURK|nr:PAS domain-containing protein [Duganella alba]MRX07702.1 PAS domain-containing protein [Duganella alba]MRX19844.1 PAS domain-containing protein [Duganella alba]